MADREKCGEKADESPNPNLLVAIGGSAGSLKEIALIVEQLPDWFQGTLLIATHRSPSHVNALARILAYRARVRVTEPEDAECLECTTIYVGRSKDRVKVDGREFDVDEDVSAYARMKRIDDLFCSVARSAGDNAVGVILSGLLSDGVRGLMEIHQAGGTCIVQDPSDADFTSMPVNALAEVPVDLVGTTQEISSRLMELALTRKCR